MAGGIIRAGIGGWDYDPWRDNFYPKGLAKAKQLAWAGERLTAIEINATYYRSQKPETFAKWGAAVPDGFKFSLKASRYSTARKVLADSGESVSFFLNQGFTGLGDRLGPILWQFAPTKVFDREDFAAFLKLLPEKQDGVTLQHALEVRHESFRDPAFVALAREKNAAIVFADDAEFPCIDEATADFAYARLQRAEADCPTGYDAAALDRWADRARRWAARGDTYIYFISGAKERNPAAAMALIERLR
jgi:uncharacterized protein YecE (DUF72 family)